MEYERDNTGKLLKGTCYNSNGSVTDVKEYNVEINFDKFGVRID